MAAGDVGAGQAILMGFTYQGPNIDYTIGSSKRVCIFGCFYLWDIRAGFALDFGLGLRLPSYSRLDGPSQMIAGATYQFSSAIETEPQGDLTPGDFGPDAYTASSVAPYGGNEFVMSRSTVMVLPPSLSATRSASVFQTLRSASRWPFSQRETVSAETSSNSRRRR